MGEVDMSKFHEETHIGPRGIQSSNMVHAFNPYLEQVGCLFKDRRCTMTDL